MIVPASLRDVRNAHITVYQYLNQTVEQYDDTTTYGSLSDLYIRREDVDKLKDSCIRRFKKQKVETLDLRKKK